MSDCKELVGVTHRRNWAKFAERIAACFFAGYLSSWNWWSSVQLDPSGYVRPL